MTSNQDNHGRQTMAQQITVTVHEIATDGLPDMDALVNRVAFLFDGCIVSGWPLQPDPERGWLWEGNSDVAHRRPFGSVTHWVEFPRPVHEIERGVA